LAQRSDPTIEREERPLAAEFDPAAADCPLELAISTIGGKWKLLVLRALFLTGGQRFNALLKSVKDISPKELTRNLRELEGAGLVVKDGERVELYRLTELGVSLLPIFRDLGELGARLASKPAPPGGSAFPPHQ